MAFPPCFASTLLSSIQLLFPLLQQLGMVPGISKKQNVNLMSLIYLQILAETQSNLSHPYLWTDGIWVSGWQSRSFGLTRTTIYVWWRRHISSSEVLEAVCREAVAFCGHFFLSPEGIRLRPQLPRSIKMAENRSFVWGLVWSENCIPPVPYPKILHQWLKDFTSVWKINLKLF